MGFMNDAGNYISGGWYTMNASGAFLVPGEPSSQYIVSLRSSVGPTMPLDYSNSELSVFLGGKEFYYPDLNIGLETFIDDDDGLEYNRGYEIEMDEMVNESYKMRKFAYFQRFFRWDNYCWRVFDSSGNLKHDLNNGDVPHNRGIGF